MAYGFVPLVDRPRSTSALQFGDDNDEGKAEDTVSEQRIGDINRNGAAARPSRKTSSSIRDTEEARLIPNCQITAISSIRPAAPSKARVRKPERPSNSYSRATNIAFTLRCKCAQAKTQQLLVTMSLKPLFYRHFDNMSLPRKLTDMNISINASQANNKETTSLPRLHPPDLNSRSSPKKNQTHVLIPRQQSRQAKCALRAEW